MPKFEKGSKEAIAWGLKMKKARESKKMKGGFLQPDELPASMRNNADPNDMANTKEEIIDGTGLKERIAAFRRKWMSK